MYWLKASIIDKIIHNKHITTGTVLIAGASEGIAASAGTKRIDMIRHNRSKLPYLVSKHVYDLGC